MGHIRAGALDENFEAPLELWTVGQYEASWRHELQQLVGGAPSAILLTLVVDPETANWLRGYVFYRFGEEVRIQEHMLILEEMPQGIDLDHPGRSAGPYESVNEDGLSISQWTMSVDDVRAFLAGTSSGVD